MLLPMFAVFAGSSSTPEQTVESTTTTFETGDVDLNTIPYVTAGYLPEGWTVGYATFRTNDGTGYYPEYTIVWLPAETAGNSRKDATDHDDDSLSVWANVASAGFSQGFTEEELDAQGFRLDGVEIEQDGTSMGMVFRVDCCLVRLGAQGITEEQFRRVAENLETVTEQEWETMLGDRLLVDDYE